MLKGGDEQSSVSSGTVAVAVENVELKSTT
jgi:hypothetical protein